MGPVREKLAYAMFWAARGQKVSVYRTCSQLQSSSVLLSQFHPRAASAQWFPMGVIYNWWLHASCTWTTVTTSTMVGCATLVPSWVLLIGMVTIERQVIPYAPPSLQQLPTHGHKLSRRICQLWKKNANKKQEVPLLSIQGRWHAL